MSIKIIDTWGTFKDLYNGSFTSDFEDLSFSDRTITETDVDDFGILGEFDVIKND